MSRRRTTAVFLLVLLAAWATAATAGAAIPRLVFPVVGKTTYVDDFGDPRGQGRHMGNDLMAAKKTPVVAVEAGRVTKWTSSSRAGCMLYLYGRSGTTYLYIHLNNDRTMRNDNRGGCRNGVAYAPGLQSGQRVQAGQLVGYVGDSGDANGGMPHLHFELHKKGRKAISPYKKLRAATRLLFPRPPASEDSFTARVDGTVIRTRSDLQPNRVALKVTKVRLSNGWVAKPARNVTLSLPEDAILRRAVSPGVFKAAELAEFEPGLRARAWTVEFPQRIAFARAAPTRHAGADLLLRLQ
jgi:hypothetical protein